MSFLIPYRKWAVAMHMANGPAMVFICICSAAGQHCCPSPASKRPQPVLLVLASPALQLSVYLLCLEKSKSLPTILTFGDNNFQRCLSYPLRKCLYSTLRLGLWEPGLWTFVSKPSLEGPHCNGNSGLTTMPVYPYCIMKTRVRTSSKLSPGQPSAAALQAMCWAQEEQLYPAQDPPNPASVKK